MGKEIEAIWQPGDRVEISSTVPWWRDRTGRVAAERSLPGWIPVVVDGAVGVFAFRDEELTRIEE